jgi:phenylacetate-CoA ligase
MMENFDDLVTDSRLRREELLERVEETGRDEYYLGSYRVMTTSGSSGRKGLFIYDESGWSAIMAQFLRHCAMMQFRPRLPRQRVAAIVGGAPTHMSRQVAANVSVAYTTSGRFRVRCASSGSSRSSTVSGRIT